MRVKNPLAITVLATVSLCPLSYTQSPDSADAAERDQLSIEATFQQAYVIVHSEDVRAVEDSYPRQFELNGLWRLNGQDTWEACRCYPIVGVWTIFTDFDNPVLGYGATGGVFVEPVFGVEEENASLRFGVGGVVSERAVRLGRESGKSKLFAPLQLLFADADRLPLPTRGTVDGETFR